MSRVLFPMFFVVLLGCPPAAEQDHEPEEATPTLPVIELRPSAPVNSDWIDLALLEPSSDAAGVALGHRVRWLRDGESVPEVDDLAGLWPELTAPGQTWRVEVSGVDGDLVGDAAVAEVTVSGSPPGISAVEIRPGGPTVSDTLEAITSGWVDADGDPEQYRYSWRIDGVEVGADAVLTPEAFDADDVVSVVVTPFDATSDGTALEAPSVTIRPDDSCFALSLDGVDDHLTFDGFLQNLTADFTVEIWAAPEAFGGEQVLLSTRLDDGGWEVALQADGRVALTAGGVTSVSDSPVPLDGALHGVTVVRRGGGAAVSFFLDGVPDGTVEATSPAGENGPMVAGRRAEADEAWFGGVLDDIRLSSLPRYLGPYSPRSYWRADGFTTGLWHFPEGSGTTSLDGTGAGRTAQVVGARWIDSPTACD